MTRSYFTEDQKMVYSPFPKWNFEEQRVIRETLIMKGFFINCVSRVGCDRKYHDAWLVERDDVPQLIEELFRQRLIVEVQAEGNYKAAINFCYDYHADTIISACRRFRNKKGDV